jgi:serine/threonine protein kinase
VILYEALTGSVPFDANAYSALILEIATGTPKRLRELRPELPKGLEDVVLKAMAREPSDRYQDVGSLARALEAFAEGVTFRADRPDLTAPRRSFGVTTTPFVSDGPVAVPVRRGSIGLVIGSVSIAVVGGLLWALQNSSDAPHADSERDNVVRPAPRPSAAAAGLDSEPKRTSPSAEPKDGGSAEERTPSAHAQHAAAGAGAPAGTQQAPPERRRSRRRSQLEPAPSPAPPATAPASRPSPVTRPGGRTGALRSDEF